MPDKNENKKLNRNNKEILQSIDNILGQASMTLYGTDRKSDIDGLNTKFHNIIHGELDTLNGKNRDEPTSFLTQLWSNNKKNSAYNNFLANQFMSISNDDVSFMASFIQEAHRNRLLEQNDLHEVASQLIELSEAILITRDAIISADVNEGRMNRTLSFDNMDRDDTTDYIPIVEKMEEKFKLLDKIKNFIIPKTLEFGEYYVYTIPYSKLFNDFMKTKNTLLGSHMYRESTLLEFVDEELKSQSKTSNSFFDGLYNTYMGTSNNVGESKNQLPKKEFTKDIKNIMERVSICNDSVPIPILEEGIDSLMQFKEKYFNVVTEDQSNKKPDLFTKVSKLTPDGIVYKNDKIEIDVEKGPFDDITDCYVKLIDPMQMVPVKIMDKVIGYYYIQVTDVTPLSGAISSTLFYNRIDESRREQTIISSIADEVVASFDKEFLKKNMKFKELIVEAINYYNLCEKRLKFQFIPAEYIEEFKIDEDENGNGQSMIKKSLFYAKLYLMLLLFKIMSIILYSNDTKVNYIKSSGIDKNVANKVQEIARIKQSRQINMYDLFNYTTLVNKIGNGNEMFVPTGRSGERPIETEILSGQDIQLNSDLLEMLKNSYILGTGVPAAIVNYLNEADFAKVVEQNNTKFNARVVNYQLDFNPSITRMYKKIMRYSTNIDPQIIENFTFTLQPPRSATGNAKSEMIGSFNTLLEFYTNLYIGEVNQDDKEQVLLLREFKKALARDMLPMLNFEKVEKMLEEAKIEAKKEKLRPSPENGDDGDDMGIADDIAELT